MDFTSRLVIIANILDGLDLHKEADLVDNILCKISDLQSQITKYSQNFSLENEKKVLYELAKILIEIQGEPLEKRVKVSTKIPPFRNPWSKLFYSGDNVSGYPKKTVVKAVQSFILMYVKNYMQDKFKQLGNDMEYGNVIDNVMNLANSLNNIYKLKGREKTEKLLSSFDRGLEKAKRLYTEVETIAAKARKHGVDFAIPELNEIPEQDNREGDALEEVQDKILEEGLNNIETKEGEELFKTFKDFMTEGFKEFKETVTPRQMGVIIKQISSDIENEDLLEQYKAEGTVEKLAEDIQSYYNNQYYLRKAFREVLEEKEPSKKERQLSIQSEEEEKIIDKFKNIIFSSNGKRIIKGQEEQKGSFNKLSQAISAGYEEIKNALNKLEDQRDEVFKLLSKYPEGEKKNEAIKKLDSAIEKFKEYRESLKSVYEVSKKLKAPMNPFLDGLLTFLSGEKETEREKWEKLHRIISPEKEINLGSILESPYSKSEFKELVMKMSKEEIEEGIDKLESNWNALFKILKIEEQQREKVRNYIESAILNKERYLYNTKIEEVVEVLKKEFAKKLENIENKQEIFKIFNEIVKWNKAEIAKRFKQISQKKLQTKIKSFVKIAQEELSANEILKDKLEDFNQALSNFQNVAQKYFGNVGDVKRQSDNLLRSMKKDKESREKFQAHIGIIENIFGDVGESGMLGKYSVGNVAQYKEMSDFDTREEQISKETLQKQQEFLKLVKEIKKEYDQNEKIRSDIEDPSIINPEISEVIIKTPSIAQISEDMVDTLYEPLKKINEKIQQDKKTQQQESTKERRQEEEKLDERVKKLKAKYETMKGNLRQEEVVAKFFEEYEEGNIPEEEIQNRLQEVHIILEQGRTSNLMEQQKKQKEDEKKVVENMEPTEKTRGIKSFYAFSR